VAAEAAARRAIRSTIDTESIIERLTLSRIEQEPDLRRWFDSMTDEEARRHYGEDYEIGPRYLRLGLRAFHAWRVNVLRQRIGERLCDAEILDVGDVDGLILRDLGKRRLGFNLAESAVRNIRANGIEAVLGDGHTMPFEEASFDYVLCFETLEHVESPFELLSELARVVRPGGSVFVSVPWVSRTAVHGRDRSAERGEMHIFEFSRGDFDAILSHTPLRIAWEAVFDVLGPPHTIAERAYLLAKRRDHMVGATFKRFQFFDLELAS